MELAIDHHGTHVPFSQERWVDAHAAAAVELIYALLGGAGVELAPAVADCLSHGLTTVTGASGTAASPPAPTDPPRTC